MVDSRERIPKKAVRKDFSTASTFCPIVQQAEPVKRTTVAESEQIRAQRLALPQSLICRCKEMRLGPRHLAFQGRIPPTRQGFSLDFRRTA
jgi:hypothetical protein